jgi:hypothetical protein
MSAHQLHADGSNEDAIAPADYLTALHANNFSATDWHLLTTRLLLGDQVTVHYTIWCRLLETEKIRSVSRAGIIIEYEGTLVRLSTPGAPRTWLQALATPPGIEKEPGHEHRIIPVELSDGWEILRCARCGAEW